MAIKVRIHAADELGGKIQDRGLQEFGRVPCVGEAIKLATPRQAVLLQVDQVIHTPGRETAADVVCTKLTHGRPDETTSARLAAAWIDKTKPRRGAWISGMPEGVPLTVGDIRDAIDRYTDDVEITFGTNRLGEELHFFRFKSRGETLLGIELSESAENLDQD